MQATCEPIAGNEAKHTIINTCLVLITTLRLISERQLLQGMYVARIKLHGAFETSGGFFPLPGAALNVTA